MEEVYEYVPIQRMHTTFKWVIVAFIAFIGVLMLIVATTPNGPLCYIPPGQPEFAKTVYEDDPNYYKYFDDPNTYPGVCAYER